MRTHGLLGTPADLSEEDTMPLLDHFHPPLAPARRWESFHSDWANAMAQHLNQEVLPADYFAEPEVRLGNQFVRLIGHPNDLAWQ